MAAVAGAADRSWQKASLANTAAGQLFSLWRAAGEPQQASIPAGAATATKALAGSFSFNNPSAPTLTYLVGLTAQLVNQGSLILFDRLAHMGGLNGTLTTAQTVAVTIPASRGAAVDGSDVEWYLEWYTDTGSTAVTATVSYTDQTDTAGRTVAISVGATTRAGRMILIPPNAGQSIKSIQSVTLSASTLTAGSFGVTCCRRIAEIPCAVTNQISRLDAMNLGIPRIYDDACLFFAMLCSTTTTGYAQGMIGIGQK